VRPDGKTVVITGASDGIGAAAARQLTERGANVVVVGRSPTKTSTVAAELGVDSFVADFGDLRQVRYLAAELRSRYPRIDILANNAGGMAHSPEPTPDGHEMIFQVNYLAPFLLTTLLLDVLIDSRATVISTSSASQSLVRRINADELTGAKRHRPSKAYGLTKLGVVLFARELHRRYQYAGISTAAFHPGWVDSNIGPASGSRLLTFANRYTPLGRFAKTPDEGADLLVWLASGEPGVDWQSGEYYVQRKIAKANGQAYNSELARALWDRSLELIAT
jgi:NAD(P)-dependent dehydrogenase (short-subunit alcohol dehydrogenase family)